MAVAQAFPAATRAVPVPFQLLRRQTEQITVNDVVIVRAQEFPVGGADAVRAMPELLHRPRITGFDQGLADEEVANGPLEVVDERRTDRPSLPALIGEHHAGGPVVVDMAVGVARYAP